MLKLRKIELKKIKNFFKRLPFILGRKAFLVFLGLFMLALVFGAFVFYIDYFLIRETEPDISQEQFNFDSKTYQEILQIWEEREQKLKETDSKSYPNPFVL